MSTLERAVVLAAKAHAGQVDKAGAPYILHPLRVMLAVEGEDVRITAVLHDVVEDCDVTLDDLSTMGFSEAVLSGVASVTRADGEAYHAFVVRAGSDPVGRVVKAADIRDNMDLSRIKQPTEKDRARLVKYRRALDYLESLTD